MNEFREWLSDNLRYFMLAGGILLALLLIFFGIRFISSLTVTDKDSDKKVAEETAEPTEAEEPTETPTPTEEPADELVKNAVPEVNTLIEQYYNAIAGNDADKLRALVDNLTAEDEANIASDPVEHYSDIDVYTLNGLEEGSYIVYVSYKYKLPDIDTLVPGLSQLYVQTDDAKNLYVCTSVPNAETQLLIEESAENEDVKQLLSTVQIDYETAINSDDALYAYFNPDAAPAETPVPEATPEPTPEATPEPTPEPTPLQETSAVPEGEKVVLKQAAHIRDRAGMKTSTVIGSYPAGTEMIKLGEEGLWFHVYVDGVYGYISNMFF